MLLTFASTHADPSITHSLHALSASSSASFEAHEPLPSPTRAEPERKAPAPRAKWDVAVANLVLHHVDHMDDFFAGAIGCLDPGGWFVATEFGRVEGQRDVVTEVRKQKMAEMEAKKAGAPLQEDGSKARPLSSRANKV